jgi:hypothetical protein
VTSFVHLQVVGEAMMKYGPQSLAAIRRRVDGRDTSDDAPMSKITVGIEQIKTTVIVFLQHNLVKMERAPASPVIIYSFIVERAVRRLRFPRFLLVIRNEFGDKGVGLMQELFISGRLKRDDLVEDAVKCIMDFENEMDESLLELDEEATEARRVTTMGDVKSVFDEMVNKRYIVPQGAALSPYEATVKTDDVDGKLFLKREKKQNHRELAGDITVKKAQDDGYTKKGGKNEMPLELRLMMNAGKTEEGDGDNDNAANGGGPKRKAGAEAGAAAKKRRTEDDEGAKGKGRSGKKNITKSIQAEQIWAPGFDQLHRSLRHNTIATFIGERLNAEAKGIVETMLRLTGPYEKSGDDKVSAQVSAKEIRNALQQYKPGVLQVLGKQGQGTTMANKQWDMLLKYLEVLHSDNSKAVIKVADESYDGTGTTKVEMTDGGKYGKQRDSSRQQSTAVTATPYLQIRTANNAQLTI